MQRAREYIKSGTGIAELLDTFPRNTTVGIGMPLIAPISMRQSRKNKAKL